MTLDMLKINATFDGQFGTLNQKGRVCDVERDRQDRTDLLARLGGQTDKAGERERERERESKGWMRRRRLLHASLIFPRVSRRRKKL